MLENLKILPEYDGFLFLAESVRNPPALKPHHHPELELNLVVEGEITYVVGRKRYTFGKRTLLWMFPDQEHHLVDRSNEAAYYVAVFKPEMISRTCRGQRYAGLKRKTFAKGGVLNTSLDPKSFDLVRGTMDALASEGIDADLLNREAGFGLSPNFSYRHNDPDWLNAGLRHLLLLCWRHQRKAEIGGEVALHPAIRKALDLMSTNEQTGDLSEIAARCGVSASYLSRLFGQQIGVPLTRYRNSIRLSCFWDRLRDSPQSDLLAIVHDAGFGSYAQFYRVFKNAYGVGPRESLKA